MVSPAKRATLSQSDDEIYLAATNFELFDGTGHVGFCFPADDSGLDYLQPAIVTGSDKELERQWQLLGKSEAEILPATFRCLIPVDGRTVTGRIHRVETAGALSVAGLAPPTLESAGAEEAEAERVPTARPGQARRDTGAVEQRTARRRKAEMEVE